MEFKIARDPRIEGPGANSVLLNDAGAPEGSLWVHHPGRGIEKLGVSGRTPGAVTGVPFTL